MNESKVQELAHKLTDLVIDERPAFALSALIITLGTFVAVHLEAAKDKAVARKEVLEMINKQMNLIFDTVENPEESRPN